MTDSDTLAAVERWFRSRGIPHFIDHDGPRRDVFIRVELRQAFVARPVYLASRDG